MKIKLYTSLLIAIVTVISLVLVQSKIFIEVKQNEKIASIEIDNFLKSIESLPVPAAGE